MEPLAYLAIIWIAVFAANILAEKTKLTPVLWFLALGSIIVNFGLAPDTDVEFIIGLADLGIILIMFALGFEENTQNFISSIKKKLGNCFFWCSRSVFGCLFTG